MASWLQNSKIIGDTLSNFMAGNGYTFATPAGQNAIPSSVLTKAQKTFSSDAENPNIPKPKTLYFVHFNLNPDLISKIEYKNKIVQQLCGIGKDAQSIEASECSGNISEKSNEMVNAQLKNDNIDPNIASSSANNKNDKAKSSEPEKIESIVDYIPSKDILKKLSFEMSKLVKSYDKPGVTFGTTELNEYNRKRIVYRSVAYDDVKVTFFDVKDNPVQQFFHAYLKFICSDFFCKNKILWESPIENNKYQNFRGYESIEGPEKPTYLGNLNSFGFNIDSNFRLINSISFCEYYMDKIMVYTIENPVVTKINWGNGATGDFSSNDITITFKYEGITNDLIGIEPNDDINWKESNKIAYTRNMVNKEIKQDVATFLQTRYETITSNIFGDVTSILKSYMNGDVKFSWNTLKHQAFDTARKYGLANEVNTLAQASRTLKNYNSKNTKGKAKYLVNMSTDPTSLIGKISGSIKPNQMRGQFII